MVKEIERVGIPVVHMCTITPISLTVGANRIIPTIAIPHPLGNPALTAEDEYALRYKLVDAAIKAFSVEVDKQTVFDVYFPIRSKRTPRGKNRGGRPEYYI